MAVLAKRRMRSKIPVLEQALAGPVRDHHRRLLAMQLRHIEFLDGHRTALNGAMAHWVTTLSQEAAVSPGPLSPTTRDVPTPAELPLSLMFTRAVELVDIIPGVNQRGAAMIIAEIRITMACFGTASRLAAGSRVAPGNKESAGK